MKRGFYTIMAAQFFSSLADNALFVAAVELLQSGGAPHWQGAALVPMFALFYVLLAPWVGAFADSRPKGRVMLISNAVKIAGCLLMLLGGHPVLAYAVVGLGAAAYSPAKYGILTELLPPSQLVKANGWIEGLTIGSIILGVVLGGQLVDPRLAPTLLALGVPGIATAPQAAIAALMVVYAVAAAFNLGIPRSEAPLRPMPARKMSLLGDFWQCNARLWTDRLGQITLSTTTLFWGVSGNMRYIVLAWAAAALGYGTTRAASLIGVVAVGTAVGAVWASLQVRLERACGVLPLGVLMGALLALMVFVRHPGLAVPFLIVLGVLAGFIVVPMNALLQHRGHNLMGAGRSIAVQNFNEQACILGLGALYSLLSGLGLHAFATIALLGGAVILAMLAIMLWYRHNLRRYPKEMARLRVLARSDRAQG
ncbi:MAG: lysophospholipid transporter LplT [Burkholderiaceae bacterium]|nr:lysophospholipid transporter LplT [Burkholderiaceae bacterium]